MSVSNFIVVHSNLHFRVGGKMTRLKKGSVIAVDRKSVGRYVKAGMLQEQSDQPAIDLDDGESTDQMSTLLARAAELKIPKYKSMKEDVLVKKIEHAEREIALAESLTE